MDAKQAVDWLHSRRYLGQKNGLENTRALLEALGNPERGFLSVHIAGTNGKGSTAAMCESCLRASGYTTGLYTSPYLEHYRERIRVNGRVHRRRGAGRRRRRAATRLRAPGGARRLSHDV